MASSNNDSTVHGLLLAIAGPAVGAAIGGVFLTVQRLLPFKKKEALPLPQPETPEQKRQRELNTSIDQRFNALITNYADEIERLGRQVSLLRGQNIDQQTQLDAHRLEREELGNRMRKLEGARQRDRNLIRKLIDWIKSTTIVIPEEIQREIDAAGHGNENGNEH